MIFPSLTEGIILKRYKRFFADIRLPSGEEVVAHVPNTGSMKTCWDVGGKAFISRSDSPTRKLQWTLEFTSTDDTNFIMVNTSQTNRLAQEALANKRIPELAHYTEIIPEQKVFESRMDFLLKANGSPDCWLEVKNVTLMESDQHAMFPDSVSSRGLKHLGDLIKLKEMGLRAAMLYVVSRTDALKFSPAAHIDPAYARGLEKARRAGVEIYCYRLEKSAEDFSLKTPLPLGDLS